MPQVLKHEKLTLPSGFPITYTEWEGGFKLFYLAAGTVLAPVDVQFLHEKLNNKDEK